MTELPERVAMRPGRRLVLVTAGSAAFAVAGVLLGGLAGLVTAAVFGGMAVLTIAMRPWQQETVIDRTSLRVTTRRGRIVVPLAEIERVGIATIWSNRTVGVLLKDPERFALSMKPEDTAGFAPFLKPAKQVLHGAAVVRNLGDPGGGPHTHATGPTRDFAEAMHWTRAAFGYDLTFDPVTYDRSAKDFAALLEAYRRATPPGAAR